MEGGGGDAEEAISSRTDHPTSTRGGSGAGQGPDNGRGLSEVENYWLKLLEPHCFQIHPRFFEGLRLIQFVQSPQRVYDTTDVERIEDLSDIPDEALERMREIRDAARRKNKLKETDE